jgi:hypothetical protein
MASACSSRISLHYITFHGSKVSQMTVGCGISHTITKSHIQFNWSIPYVHTHTYKYKLNTVNLHYVHKPLRGWVSFTGIHVVSQETIMYKTANKMKSSVLYDIKLCSPLKGNWLHGIIFQKREFFITTAVRTSNPANKLSQNVAEFK